jgi:tungstate transport system substrate-binding protein
MSLAVSLIAPAAAMAATPVPTIVLGTTYQPKAAPLKVTGFVGKAYKGQIVRIEIKKPGRSYWAPISYRGVDAYGRYAYSYAPKLAGKFYIRARFGTATPRYSRTASFVVKQGPGVKTQILLSSTTSTKDSGLFERIGPAFLAACPEYTLKANFVGSGAAIAAGGSGNADVLLTHSPAAEVQFMNGFVASGANWVPSTYKGLTRYKVMYNDYILVGPKSNPYGIVTTETAAAAFSRFTTETASGFTTGTVFWSRNDASGTNSKEKEIWGLIGNPQKGASWYFLSSQFGMAQALAACNELGTTGGYTLADRATWLNANSLGTVKNLKIVNEGDAKYFNQYSVIEVKGARNVEGAQDFSLWIRSPQAQELIRTFGEYTYPGQIMFVPNQGSYLP